MEWTWMWTKTKVKEDDNSRTGEMLRTDDGKNSSEMGLAVGELSLNRFSFLLD